MSKTWTPRWFPLLAILVITAFAGLVAGCGSDDEEKGGGSGATPKAQDGGDSAVPADVAARVEKHFDEKGSFKSPPTTGPKPEPGKKVWIISCSQQINSCADPSNDAARAAKLIGWKPTVCDGKFTPQTEGSCVRQAIAAKADGIILAAVDCQNAKGPLQRAKSAGIKIVSFYAMDCDDPNVGGEPLFDASNVIEGTQTYSDVVQNWGATRAAYIIAKTKGKAKVIHFDWPQLLVLKYVKEGFEKEMAKCSGCEIVDTISFTGEDLGPGLAGKVSASLLKNPDANAIAGLNDGSWVAGIAQGLQTAGAARAKKLLKVGGEAFPANIALLKQGKVDAEIAFPAAWNGWGSIDTINRIFQGEEPVETGIGWQILDKDHNMPSGKSYVPPVDYEAAYKKAWGV